MSLKKDTIKKTVLLATVCCVFTACERTGDLNSNEMNNVEEPTALHITPIEKLNQGAATVNSHVDFTTRSSLKMNFRSYVHLGQNSLGVAKPNYPRVTSHQQLEGHGWL